MSRKRPIRQRNGIAKSLSGRPFQPKVIPNKKKLNNKKRNKDLTDELEGDGLEEATLELHEDNPKSNVHAFTVHANPKNLDKSLENATPTEMMDIGLTTFTEELKKNAKGFLAIIFDEDGNQRIIWAGEVDMVTSVGALEIAKNELFKTFAETD